MQNSYVQNGIVEWQERNGKNGVAEMDAGGCECLVYRIVHYPQPREIRIFQGYGYSHDYGTMFIVYFLHHALLHVSFRIMRYLTVSYTTDTIP